MNDICTVGELKEALKDIPNDVYLANGIYTSRRFSIKNIYSKDYIHQTVELVPEKNPELTRMIRKDMLDKLGLGEVSSLVKLVYENYNMIIFLEEVRKHCDDYLVDGKLMNAYDILGKYRIDMDTLKQIATPSNMPTVSEELLRKFSE